MAKRVFVNSKTGETTEEEFTPLEPSPEELERETQEFRKHAKVSRFQFLEALRDAGQLQTFIDAAQAVGGRDLRAFEQVTEVRRNSNFIEAVRVQVGATQEAVDNLFKAAQAIAE